MKTPRLTDFDPDAKVPTLKSSLDSMPVIQKPQPKPINHTPLPEITSPVEPDRTTTRPALTEQPVPHPVPGTASGTPYPVPLMKRRMRQRQPFDVYEDQYETLKRIADEERAAGLPGSMSRMVREGIDMYLKAKEKKEK